jgi:anti-anti-sigma factor
MEPHLGASTTSPLTRGEPGAERKVISSRARMATTSTRDARVAPDIPGKPAVTLASVRLRTHTLTIAGELNYRSATVLEHEIERLCDDGVTGITLDLRDLSFIDAVGVAVISFRSRLCKRRGYDFAIIPGSQLVHRALEEAGAVDLRPFDGGDELAQPAAVTRLNARSSFPRRTGWRRNG